MISKLALVLAFSTLLATENTFANSSQNNETEMLVREIVALSTPNRGVGQAGHKKTQEYLKAEFEKLAKQGKGRFFAHEFQPDIEFAVKNYNDDFKNLIAKKHKPSDPTYKKWKEFTDTAIKFVRSFKGKKGTNLVLELPGKSKSSEVLYIGAHYDTITHNHENMTFTPEAPAPGADDNASGVAALIAAARHFAGVEREKTLRFVAFDYEEVFFLGSYAFAKDLKNNKVKEIKKGETYLGLINLEMIGWSSKKLSEKPVVKVYTRDPKAKGADKDSALAKIVEEEAKKFSVTLQTLPNGFNRSDNWPFWVNDFHAITISEDWESDFNEKNYHTNHDNPDNLNFPYLQEITKLLISTVAKLSAN